MTEFVIEPWDEKRHVRDAFTCGEPSLDRFLHQFVKQYDKRRLGKTFVATKSGANDVLAYYTLAAGSLAYAGFPASVAKKLPKHPVPVILLGRLAVDTSVRGEGLGTKLLMDAAWRVCDLAKSLGVYALKVEAIDAGAKTFYERFGFVPLEDNPLHLFLPVATIKASKMA
ncbi:MAG: GNAT family N-acetyltransferase [Gemmataceae bacterium]